MNPQYVQPQQFGAPPQGYPTNRPAQSLTPQGFQTLPLGPQKPVNDGPAANSSNQLPRPPAVPSLGQPNSLPLNVNAQNSFGSTPGVLNQQPGLPRPVQSMPPGQANFNNFAPGQGLPPGNIPSGQLPPLPKQNQPPLTTPSSQLPPSQIPSNVKQPSPQLSGATQPPLGPPGPPSVPPSNSVPPMAASTNMPPSSTPGYSFFPPSNQIPSTGSPPDPQTNNASSNTSAGTNPFGQPPLPQGGMPPGPPGTGQLNAPTGVMPPLNNGFNPTIQTLPLNFNAPSSQMNQQPINMGRTLNSMERSPSNMGIANAQFPGQPPQNLGPRPSPQQFGGPPLNQFMQNGSGNLPPKIGQLPPPGPGAQRPPIPPANQFVQGNQMPPPLNQQYGAQPSNLATNQFGVNPPNQFGAPPLPGQNYGAPPGPNQLTNQMQNMQIGGARPYQPAPGMPGMPGAIKQDNGPHMPPPLNQQQQQHGYMNGPQSRAPQSPGYPPPMPGQMPGAPVGSYPTQSGYQQPQQSRRLDPDQMPSPIQVTQDDQRTRSGVFATNQKGAVPPLVSTSFVVQDQGNASPRFIRSTMYNVPITQDLMKQTAVPFGLIISPMARIVDQEYPPPIVNFGELGPVRCIRCKAYMCPYMQFIDSGRRFQCLFCKATTDVPTDYFQHLDHTGQRIDRFERPELILGTYEFVATTDYCRNNVYPKPPAIIFLIDVSYNNIKSGLVHLLCAEMKEIIKNLPVDQGCEKSNMKVGFITYNSVVHFYNIKGNLAQPQMMVVGDTQEMFMPLLDGFLCTPEESGPVIDSLMQQIPAMFGDTRETETVLLPAIQAGLEALKASECTGKLLVFHSTLPIAEAPGKLKNRDDRKLLGTEKERTVLTPQTQVYNQLGQDCVAVGCCVDLFVFNNAYIDVATIGQVCRLTGGEVFKYTYFQSDLDGERLIQDIIMDINRPIAFDSIMRVRTSTGVRPTDFNGHFYMSNTTDMEIAAIDCDKAIGIEVKHDDKLTEEDGVYIQVALLYTSCSGQRRLRIINLALKTCSQMADLYRSCDLDTIVNFFAKQSIYKLNENNPKAVKDALINRSAQMLANYRKNCASPSSAGQLILPECMKLLPLYVNCLLKSDALSGGSDITLDDRSFVMQAVTTMDIPSSTGYFYPRLLPLHEVSPSSDVLNVELPFAIRCSVEKMTDQGVYLLENGIHMFLWIGLQVNPEWIQQVFGVASAAQVDVDRIALPELENNLSNTIRAVINQLRLQRHRCMRLTLVRQREKLEPVFKHFLVEDRGQDGSASYVDFLCHMHKEIRALLS